MPTSNRPADDSYEILSHAGVARTILAPATISSVIKLNTTNGSPTGARS